MSGSGNRLALLIGVQHYPNLGSLNTPYQDVRLVRRTLLRCGFPDENITTLPTDPGQRVSVSDIRRAVAQFAARLNELGAQRHDDNGCAVVYFAGHGVTHERESLLLSDHASLDHSDLAAEGLPLSELVQKVGRLDFPVVVLIDACQSLSKSRGLISDPVSLPNFLIGDMHVDLATCPGEVAFDGVHNSPYALALSQQMPVVGRSIGDMLVAVRRSVRSSSQDRQNPQSMSSISSSQPFISAGQAADRTAAASPSSPSELGSARFGVLRPRRNYSNAEVRARGRFIHKLKAKDSSGRWAYYYVLVEPPFEAGFLHAFNDSGEIDLENFGVVIASSYGETPTMEVRQYLLETYGFSLADTAAQAPLPANAALPATIDNRIEKGKQALMPDMVAALKQQTGRARWQWVILWVPGHNRVGFLNAVQQLSKLDHQFRRPKASNRLVGDVLDAVSGVHKSAFDLPTLATWGRILHQGEGEIILGSFIHAVQDHYRMKFDWSQWDATDTAIADVP